MRLLKSSKNNVKLVVVSACHSGKLGKVLTENGIPMVVAINSSVAVLEKAAFIFNESFLRFLLMKKTVRQSFKEALDAVNA